MGWERLTRRLNAGTGKLGVTQDAGYFIEDWVVWAVHTEGQFKRVTMAEEGGQRSSIARKAVERVAVGILAAGGLVTAACISALPNSRCAALAWVYYQQISIFGSAAAGALMVLGLIALPKPKTRWYILIELVGTVFILGTSGLRMGFGVSQGLADLSSAITVCWHAKE